MQGKKSSDKRYIFPSLITRMGSRNSQFFERSLRTNSLLCSCDKRFKNDHRICCLPLCHYSVPHIKKFREIAEKNGWVIGESTRSPTSTATAKLHSLQVFSWLWLSEWSAWDFSGYHIAVGCWIGPPHPRFHQRQSSEEKLTTKQTWLTLKLKQDKPFHWWRSRRSLGEPYSKKKDPQESDPQESAPQESNHSCDIKWTAQNTEDERKFCLISRDIGISGVWTLTWWLGREYASRVKVINLFHCVKGNHGSWLEPKMIGVSFYGYFEKNHSVCNTYWVHAAHRYERILSLRFEK